MIHPKIDVLLEHVDSKYALVIAAAKRAGVAAWIIGEVREGTRGVKFAER